jgi:quercetin dioxygenase-like cupin family protein
MNKNRSTDENVGISHADRQENLLEWLYQLRDRQRQHQRQGAWLIKGRDIPWENNRQGKMKWFLHPALDNTSIRSMIVFEQEIPPGGRSGAQKTPGGSVLYILEGRGYTLRDGERHDWQAEDLVNIPIRAQGVVVQHVNTHPRRRVRFVSADLNLVDILGVDRGAELEQIETAPTRDENKEWQRAQNARQRR